MKRLITITALILLTVLTTFSQTVDLKKGLVAYYPFSGNANDESKNGNHGTVKGATLTTDRNEKTNGAYSFDGKNDYITINHNFNSYRELTISIWIYINSSTSDFQALVSSDNAGKFTHLQAHNAGKSIVYANGTSVELKPISTSPYKTWRHILLVCKSGNTKIYENGNVFSSSRTRFNSIRNTTRLIIGAGHLNKRFLYGKADEIRIYDRALNESEIKTLYNNGTNILKPPVISWVSPANLNIETSDLQYTLKVSIQSDNQIKSIKVMSGNTILAENTYLYLSNGKGTFEKNISLIAGVNEITIIANNEDGSTTSTSRTIKLNEPQAPPLLSISNINFTEKNGNNRIDGDEKCFINFSITNNGKGSANNLNVLVQNNSSVSGLAFNNSTSLGTIAPNTTQNVTIPIFGTMDLTSGKANIEISFKENMGFPPDQFELIIETKEFIKPDIKVVDYSFLTDNGSIKLGLPIQLKILIQNVGQGIAENVNVNFHIPSQNLFPNGKKDFIIGTMTAGSSNEFVFEFIANKLYTDKTIPVTIKLSEKYGKFSQDKLVSAEIDTKSLGNTITIKSNAINNAVNIQVASLTADVDKNIPQNANKYPYRYALIIGNEDYSSRQTGLNTEVNVAFAKNDAKIFKKYAINTLGVEEQNCFLLLDATAGEMFQKINLISQILARLGEKSELIFYYAGHGFPSETTKSSYIIPVDVSATNLQSAIKLTDIYNQFSQTNAKRITMFLDACFTGGGRNQGLLAARSVKIKPKKETLTGNMVVFSATSEQQSALPYIEKQHGIFTYFLLKKLQESKGEITYDELGQYIIDNISIESLRINNKPQDPKVNVSFDAKNTWKTWQMK
jgi:concanavalin A-like lectin/glucanase superfamily protein/caspase domain-containing protein